MIVKQTQKRRLCVVLQSWLLLAQICWMVFLCSDFRSALTGTSFDSSAKQLRVTSSPGYDDEESSYPDESGESGVSGDSEEPRLSVDAFIELLGASDKRLPIFEGRYDLVWLGSLNNVTSDASSYHGVKCSFCPVGWEKQKVEPNTVPRYANVYNTKDCNKHEIAEVTFDFADLVKMVRRYDQLQASKARQMKQAGFIFHESRCGSTLVANMLTVGNPDTTRVYSEPSVLLKAMKTNNKQLVEDVMYMLGRTNKNSREKRVFYKLKSDAVRHIDAMPEEVPWIFLYREPEQVMTSHFHPTEHVSGTVCLHERKSSHPSPLIEEIANEMGTHYKELDDESFCAVRLASLCLAAIRQHERTNKGRFVNYKTLPDSLWESIAPDHFGLELSSTSIKRMQDISKVYSKGSSKRTAGKEWDNDEEKVNLTTKEQQEASQKILMPYFNRMEKLSKEWMTSSV